MCLANILAEGLYHRSLGYHPRNCDSYKQVLAEGHTHLAARLVNMPSANGRRSNIEPGATPQATVSHGFGHTRDGEKDAKHMLRE